MPGTKRKDESNQDGDMESTKKKRNTRQPSEKLHMTTRRAKSILESQSSATPSGNSSNYEESRRSSTQSGLSASSAGRKNSMEEVENPVADELLHFLRDGQPSVEKIEESIEPESLGPPKKKFAVPAIQVDAPGTSSKKLSKSSTTAPKALLEVPSPSPSPAKGRRGRPPTTRQSSSIRQSPTVGKRPPGRQRVPKKDPKIEADYVRMGELKSIFGKVSKGLARTLEELADRSLDKMISDPKAHTEVRGFREIIQDLERRKREQLAMIEGEFQLQKEQAERVCKTDLQEIFHKSQIQCREIREDIRTHIDVGMMALLTELETDGDVTDDEVENIWRPTPSRYNVRNRGHFKGTYHFSERYRMPDREGRFYQEADTVFEDFMDRYNLAQAIKSVDPSQKGLESKDRNTPPVLPRPYDQVQKKSHLDHIGIEMILGASVALEDRQHARLDDLASLAEARADARDAEAAAERKKLLKKKAKRVAKKRIGSSPLPPPVEDHPPADLTPPTPARRRLLAPKPFPPALPLPMYNHEYNSPMYPDYQPSRGAAQEMAPLYAPGNPPAAAELQAAAGAGEYQHMFFGYPAQPSSYYPQDPNLAAPGPQPQPDHFPRPGTPMATTFVHYDGPSPSQPPAAYRQIAPAPGAMLPPPRPVAWNQWLMPATGGAFPPHMPSNWS
ncbi:MAG: hypothetical protein FRX48_04119 [Lasallia pustulata]|uniref:Uncharacterized protein n=1 Tax=Lasallia pustulata TaxID=136370 RepID=A0A5M8PR03_9LECA|nr:MAG: hypothetical protein FRX48_04119 [Lasallia pustulata]